MQDRSRALDELVPLVRPWAVGVAMLLCRDAAQAQDLVQDALVQAVRRPPQPLDAATLRAWLRPVIFRLYLRHRDRLRREAAALVRLAALRQPERCELGEPADELLAALGALTPKQRACVVLRYLEDLSEAQVAELLGLRLGTVKAHLAGGRERLRVALRPAYDGVVAERPASAG